MQMVTKKGEKSLILSQAGAKSAVAAEAHNARLCCFHMRGLLFGSRRNSGGSAPGQTAVRQRRSCRGLNRTVDVAPSSETLNVLVYLWCGAAETGRDPAGLPLPTCNIRA